MSEFEFGLAEKKVFNICGIDVELKMIADDFIDARMALDERFPKPRDKATEAIWKSDLSNLWADFHITGFQAFTFNGKLVEYSKKNARVLMGGELFERELVSTVTNRLNFGKKIDLDFEFTKKK